MPDTPVIERLTLALRATALMNHSNSTVSLYIGLYISEARALRIHPNNSVEIFMTVGKMISDKIVIGSYETTLTIKSSFSFINQFLYEHQISIFNQNQISLFIKIFLINFGARLSIQCVLSLQLVQTGSTSEMQTHRIL